MLPETDEDVEIEGDDTEVTDTEDGGAIVSLKEEGDDEEEEAPDKEFYRNLADSIPEGELSDVALELVDLIDRDKEARRKRDEQYEEGVRRTGAGEDAPGGAAFEGASRVVHPMLIEACIDFSARAMKELFPAQGPAKAFIPGDSTRDKLRKADRKTRMLNWQLTVQSPEFRGELEQLLTQVPLGGAQYLKVTWGEPRKRPCFLFVAIDDMFLPFAATNFYSSHRKTHRQYVTAAEFKERVQSGMYRDVELVPESAEPERSETDKATGKIEGREETTYNEDGLRTVYEVYTTAEFDVDGETNAPYIITIDGPTDKVLAVYRNWSEDDDSREELQWFVEFPFVPWRGAYPIGLTHMIGGLSAASTGALRALLDSAHINNSQTMLKLKGAGVGGQTLDIQPTQILEVEGSLNVDDVRKLAMPLPYPPPSPVLFQLLGFLIEAGKGVVRTTLDDVPDTNPNMPVGTALARIEQGLVVFSAIHARLHNAMAGVLRILHRLNGLYLDDADTKEEAGEELARRADFLGPLDVVPVSDPNIFSEMQRFAQAQAVAQRAAAMPALYKARNVEEYLLETLKVPNAKNLLIDATEPKEQNAINENVSATLGRPILAFPEQDHVAHLKAHLSYMVSPVLGFSPLIAPGFIPVMLGHLKEHVALWYASTAFELGNEHTGKDIGDEMKNNKSPESKRAFDIAIGELSQTVSDKATEVFAKLPDAVGKAMQIMQQFAPQPISDPRVQQQQAETQRKAQADQARTQLDMQKTQIDAQATQAQMQIEAQKMQAEQQTKAQELALKVQTLQLQLAQAQAEQQAEDRRTAAEIAARAQMNTQDNMTALQLAELEVASGEKFAVSTGTGINPGT